MDGDKVIITVFDDGKVVEEIETNACIFSALTKDGVSARTWFSGIDGIDLVSVYGAAKEALIRLKSKHPNLDLHLLMLKSLDVIKSEKMLDVDTYNEDLEMETSGVQE